jgi:hypothetical protein
MNKPDTTKEDGATIDNSAPGIAPVAFLLKTGTAMKLGKQAVGGISYQILTDRQRTEPMIKIIANKGGYFSKEVLPFKNVEACIDKQDRDQAFPSKLFQAAFTGRSNNNGGFLAAILRAEGLLALAPDAEGRHVIAGDWTVWKAALLAEPGEPVVTEAAPSEEAKQNDDVAEPDHVGEKTTPTLTGRKK